MRISPLFTPSDDQIDRLIAENPLATLVSSGVGGLEATPLPLLARRQAPGRLTLLGHFARSNPQVTSLETSPEALAVFQGPHGYVSPSWMTDRQQAPTWNFATVHLRVRVLFDTSPGAAAEAVNELTISMERGRPLTWAPRELGERYDKLIHGIVAFRAEVTEVQAKFKLGQNERLDVLSDILRAIPIDGETGLRALMVEHNAERLAAAELFPAGGSPSATRSA